MRAAIKLVENQGATVVGKHKTAKIIKAKKCFERFFFLFIHCPSPPKTFISFFDVYSPFRELLTF